MNNVAVDDDDSMRNQMLRLMSLMTGGDHGYDDDVSDVNGGDGMSLIKRKLFEQSEGKSRFFTLKVKSMSGTTWTLHLQNKGHSDETQKCHCDGLTQSCLLERKYYTALQLRCLCYNFFRTAPLFTNKSEIDLNIQGIQEK
uniref:Uncharacterized protein n=1 Tax=Tetranychus urticae TaxID=32264 RepID=T1KS95_TETUR